MTAAAAAANRSASSGAKGRPARCAAAARRRKSSQDGGGGSAILTVGPQPPEAQPASPFYGREIHRVAAAFAAAVPSLVLAWCGDWEDRIRAGRLLRCREVG